MSGMAGKTDLLPGFTEPVPDSARCFRAILEAMARPGSVQPLPVLPPAPKGWNAGMTAAAMCLLDADTPVWLSPAADTDAARAHLAFQCGAPIVAEADRAAFILADAGDLPELAHRPAVGIPDYPDRAATLILRTGGFGGAQAAMLSGPGIKDTVRFAPSGVSKEGWAVLQENSALFPLGFDTVFAAPEAVAALPRSTRISL
jgi:alpha-D-ribose 1-methylphosphonate 5-triphosphate synthase subunit PhnH